MPIGPKGEKIKKRGRPVTRSINIDATAEEIARAIFRVAKKPDPSIRVTKQNSKP